MVEHYGIAGWLSGRAGWDSRISQWVEQDGIVEWLSGGRTLWDSGMAQWVEHYDIVGYLSG